MFPMEEREGRKEGREEGRKEGRKGREGGRKGLNEGSWIRGSLRTLLVLTYHELMMQ